jgi:hypothetical protein
MSNRSILGGAIVGVVAAELVRKKSLKVIKQDNDIRLAFEERNALSKELALPESLATEVGQHIKDVKYEDVFDELAGRK